MASSSSASSSSMPESVSEGLEFSSEAKHNHILLMALMEETQQEEDLQHYTDDDRLMSMIQSLEAEISSTSSSDPYYQSFDMDVGEVDDQDISTSSLSFSTYWEDMEVVSARSSSSSYSFDEGMVNAWSLYEARGDDSGDYSSEFYYGVVLEDYSPDEASDVMF